MTDQQLQTSLANVSPTLASKRRIYSLKISQDVLEVLDRAQVDGNRFMLGSGQLDRKLYQDVNRVLEAIGGKWNRGAKAHLFDGDVSDVLDPILETGEYSRTKQDFGQFDSPRDVVERVIELACIEPGMSVMEPSAGLGNIALAAAYAGGHVVASEIDPKRCEHLVTVMRPAPGINMVVERDFMSEEPADTYDRVVMNPPFSKQADIHHVMHAAKFLKPGGRLVSVMSAGVLFRENKLTASFREFVSGHGGEFERLPDASFQSAGTAIHTCIVSFDL